MAAAKVEKTAASSRPRRTPKAATTTESSPPEPKPKEITTKPRVTAPKRTTIPESAATKVIKKKAPGKKATQASEKKTKTKAVAAAEEVKKRSEAKADEANKPEAKTSDPGVKIKGVGKGTNKGADKSKKNAKGKGKAETETWTNYITDKREGQDESAEQLQQQVQGVFGQAWDLAANAVEAVRNAVSRSPPRQSTSEGPTPELTRQMEEMQKNMEGMQKNFPSTFGGDFTSSEHVSFGSHHGSPFATGQQQKGAPSWNTGLDLPEQMREMQKTMQGAMGAPFRSPAQGPAPKDGRARSNSPFKRDGNTTTKNTKGHRAKSASPFEAAPRARDPREPTWQWSGRPFWPKGARGYFPLIESPTGRPLPPDPFEPHTTKYQEDHLGFPTDMPADEKEFWRVQLLKHFPDDVPEAWKQHRFSKKSFGGKKLAWKGGYSKPDFHWAVKREGGNLIFTPGHKKLDPAERTEPWTYKEDSEGFPEEMSAIENQWWKHRLMLLS